MVQPSAAHTGKIADEICVLRGMYTEAINHDPAITFFQTGSQLPGRPCMGSWVDYGLGSENQKLPAFVVLNSLPSNSMPDQGLLSRLWGAGFLPSRYQGVQFRSAGDPVLALSNPPGITRELRRESARRASRHSITIAYPRRRSGNRDSHRAIRDGVPHASERARSRRHCRRSRSTYTSCTARIAKARNLRGELSDGAPAGRARRAFHPALPSRLGPSRRADAEAARFSPGTPTSRQRRLILDLKQRGLLEDTLVIWGGEFGRTPYAQGAPKPDNYGRDHHGRVFSLWMAGGGIKRGLRARAVG